MRPASLLIALLTFVVVAPVRAEQQPVKVFILSGQSNMVGWSHIRTLDNRKKDPESRALLARIKKGKERWVERDDVFIYANVDDKILKGNLSVGFGGGGKDWIGPELLLGIELGDHFDEPVLLIKAAWGGKDLYCDFRPPGAGEPAYSIPPRGDTPREQGAYYRKLVEEVHRALDGMARDFPALKRRKVELCGFVWFQGWNEMFADKAIQEQVYAEYASNFAHLVEDLRREFEAPDLPVVVGEMGVNGEDVRENIQKLRAAQAEIPQQSALSGNCALVPTARFWDTEVDAAFDHREEVSRTIYRKLEPGIERKLKRSMKGKDDKERDRMVRDATNKAVHATSKYQAADESWQRIGSHWECHYHGSAKIYSLIGQSLGKEMIRLVRRQ